MKKHGAKCPVCSRRFTVNGWGRCRICQNRHKREQWASNADYRGKGRVRRMVNRYVNPAAEARHQRHDHRWGRKDLMVQTADGSVTRGVMLHLVRQEYCAYCACALNNLNRSVDHLVPLARGGRHTATNLRACCVECNTSKGDQLLDEWRPEIGRVPSLSAILSWWGHVS
jgi:5-methylcytosine-specific restriction endonuclease McrA